MQLIEALDGEEVEEPDDEEVGLRAGSVDDLRAKVLGH